MFTFQSIMFVSLGFLCALLLGFVVAPAFWARAVRLTTQRIRASLPLTEREISAERDRLRAENAIRVHQLSAKIEQGRLFDARQRVEINRRDGTISALQRRLEAVEGEREASDNARRVLEATITQRVPEVEGRLLEARQLLAERDTEMKALQGDTGKTFRALDEAMQLNAQQRAEIDRLKMTLAGQGLRTQSGEGNAETETALRAELEKLRARSREQAKQLTHYRAKLDEESGTGTSGAQSDVSLKAASGDTDDMRALKRAVAEQRHEIAGLKAQLTEAEGRSDAAGDEAEIGAGSAGARKRASGSGSAAALRAQINAAQKDLAAKDKSISTLKRDLATANERIARQASYYQDELRRLGARSGSGSSAGIGKNGVDALTGGGKGRDASISAAGAGMAPPPPPIPERVSAEANADAGPVALAEDVTAEASKAGKPKNGPVVRQSLEQRLASAGAAAPEEAGDVADFDQHIAIDEAPPPREPRTKLMDRIAGLAKR